MLVCVCGLEASWWWLSKEFCIYLGSRGGGWGKGNKILDFSCSIFCWFLKLLCQNLTNDFYLTKVAKFPEVIKLCKCRYSYRGWFIKWFLLSQTSLSFVFSRVLNCFIRYAIKRSMIITLNQEFIAFNEPMVLFLFNSLHFLS